MTRNVEGVVLKKNNWRENDLEIIFFSKEWGKMRLIAVGARKLKSKLSGLLEPFNELKMMLADGRSLDKIGQVSGIKNFWLSNKNEEWRNHWEAQRTANLLDEILPEKQEEPEIYKLLKNYLSLLSKTAAKKISPLFNWQLLVLSGFAPALENCVNCGGEIFQEAPVLSAAKGGLLCADCFSKNEGQKISRRELKLLQYLIAHSGQKTAWLKINEEEADFLEKLFNKFYSYYILK